MESKNQRMKIIIRSPFDSFHLARSVVLSFYKSVMSDFMTNKTQNKSLQNTDKTTWLVCAPNSIGGLPIKRNEFFFK